MQNYNIVALAPGRWRVVGDQGLILETDDTAVLLKYGAKPDDLQSLIAQAEVLGPSSADDEPDDDWDDGKSALAPSTDVQDTAL